MGRTIPVGKTNMAGEAAETDTRCGVAKPKFWHVNPFTNVACSHDNI